MAMIMLMSPRAISHQINLLIGPRAIQYKIIPNPNKSAPITIKNKEMVEMILISQRLNKKDDRRGKKELLKGKREQIILKCTKCKEVG